MKMMQFFMCSDIAAAFQENGCRDSKKDDDGENLRKSFLAAIHMHI